MTPLRRSWVWFALVLGVWPGWNAPLRAQAVPAPPGITNAAPPILKSPVDTFRELLAMKPADRDRYLTNRPPPVRAQLEKKIREYEAMKPEEREAKLTATGLRWYLEQFILSPSPDREAQLAQVPAPYREALKQRLDQFQRLPPPLQKEVLQHETTRDYFLGQGTMTNQGLPLAALVPHAPATLNEFSRLPGAQREKIYASFRNFFELDDTDRQKVLNTLTVPERRQVEKTLQALERLPMDQRDRGLESLDKLATLTDEQRRMFFRNAGRWQEMSASERETWVKLVSHLPPQAPASLLPPPPMLLPRIPRPGEFQATNSPGP